MPFVLIGRADAPRLRRRYLRARPRAPPRIAAAGARGPGLRRRAASMPMMDWRRAYAGAAMPAARQARARFRIPRPVERGFAAIISRHWLAGATCRIRHFPLWPVALYRDAPMMLGHRRWGQRTRRRGAGDGHAARWPRRRPTARQGLRISRISANAHARRVAFVARPARRGDMRRAAAAAFLAARHTQFWRDDILSPLTRFERARAHFTPHGRMVSLMAERAGLQASATRAMRKPVESMPRRAHISRGLRDNKLLGGRLRQGILRARCRDEITKKRPIAIRSAARISPGRWPVPGRPTIYAEKAADAPSRAQAAWAARRACARADASFFCRYRRFKGRHRLRLPCALSARCSASATACVAICAAFPGRRAYHICQKFHGDSWPIADCYHRRPQKRTLPFHT